jgi:hypothetical protein
MVEKGILIKDLLNSNVFAFVFDFDEWPSVHTNRETYMRPYNGELFAIRKSYRMIFPEPEFEPID